MRPAIKGYLMPLGMRVFPLRVNPGHVHTSTRRYAQIATLKDIPAVRVKIPVTRA